MIVSIIDEPERGFSLGATDYLLKPFDRDDFLQRLRRHILPPKPLSHPVKILIIDDDPLAVETLARMLESEGFTISKAYSGRQGLDLAFEQLPDVIVVDLLMPDISGFEFVQHLKEHAQMNTTPVFVVTVKDLTIDDVKRLNAVASAVMQKGAFVRDEFVQQVKRLIRPKPTQERKVEHDR